MKYKTMADNQNSLYINKQCRMCAQPYVTYKEPAVKLSPLAAEKLGDLAPFAAAFCHRKYAYISRGACCPACMRPHGMGQATAALRAPSGHAYPASSTPSDNDRKAHGSPANALAATPIGNETPQRKPAGLGRADDSPERTTEMSEAMNPIDRFAPTPEDGGAMLPEESAGLLRYKKWWFLRPVDVHVAGEMLSGIPIFIENDTMRLADKSYSYFIPLGKIDFIRTCDGLDTDVNA